MQNKKTIMAFSGLFVLIFHLWINLTNLQMEMYIKHLCVIGVDLFFFVSAYSIEKITKKEYKSFIKNRFNKIYLKFVLFAIIGALCFKWGMLRFIKIILGIEFFTKGGGSFLWFLPSIMIVYLVLPFYKMLDVKHPKIPPFVTILLVLLGAIMINFTKNHAILIFINRIPILLLGYSFSKYAIFEFLNENKIKYWMIAIAFLLVGIAITYFVYFYHFKVSWFKDLHYLFYIPLVIGILLLLDKIKENKLIEVMGSSTLELYALQMLFGFRIATIFFKYIEIKIISNLLTIMVLILFSITFHYLFCLKEKLNFKFTKKITSYFQS